MKKLIPFFFFILASDVSFAQQDIAVNVNMKVSSKTETASTDSGSVVTYMVMSTDKKVKGEFKDLDIKISPNPVKGMMSLEIKSKKDLKVLMELKNSLEDVLLFQPVDIKEGDNIIPFETDDESVSSFQLKLSGVDSNSSSSFLLLKK